MKYKVIASAAVRHTIVVEANNPQEASDKAAQIDFDDWRLADWETTDWEVQQQSSDE